MTHFLHQQVERAILLLLEDLATPFSLKVSLLWRAGQWDDISSLKVDPHSYTDPDSYWRDATAASVVRKLEELPTSIDREAVAEKAFLDCELECFRTNSRLFPYLCPGLPDTDEGVLAYIRKAQKITRRILGPCPDTHQIRETYTPLTGRVSGSADYVIKGRFGPGATFGDRGAFTTVPHKMSSDPSITPGARFYHFPWWDTMWAKACSSSGRVPSYVQGNRFTTVPKDSTKHRGIAVEPSINLFFQLGYGRYIRKRLGLAGINLAKGQDIHKRVAREASKLGHLSTLDLSNASDTICSNLVKLLLPSDWFEVLNDLRSKKTLFKGSWRLLEKFSSMGNGFTFELETLIFTSLALALDPTDYQLVPGYSVFVFGDDIVIPSEYSKAMISTLRFFGMSVNKTKSFVDGPFRESCGGDYFQGVDVRPFFLKESPSEPQHLISFANGLRRLWAEDVRRKDRVFRSWLCVVNALPVPIRDCRGPNVLGDLLLHDEETRWRPRHRSGIRYFRVYRPARYRQVSWKNFSPEVTLAGAVFGVGSGNPNHRARSPHNGGVIPRDAVIGYKLGWVSSS